MSETKNIPLQFPIQTTTSGGAKATISSVEIRRLKGRDLKFLPKDGAGHDAIIPLIASVTGLKAEDIGDMDLIDLNNVGKEIMSFSEGYPEASGSTLSGVSPQPTTSPLKQ